MPLIVVWVGLHVSILLVMMPAYWIQMWCYLALVNWPWLIRAVGGSSAPATVFATGGVGPVVFTAIGIAACLALVMVLVRSSEEWPFTAVPMYSNGIPAAEIPLPAPGDLRARALRARRGRYSSWERAWVADEVMEDIWLGDPGDPASRSLTTAMYLGDGPRLVRWSQYHKVVRDLAIADLAARPADRTDFAADDRDYPGTRFLGELARLARNVAPEWTNHDGLRLVCRTRDGWTVVARAGFGVEQLVGRSSDGWGDRV
jgi:hypothetical protein